MSTENTFVVFYSNFCNHSRSFLTRLKQLDTGLYDKFTKICVDNNQSIPKAIQSVPTIIVPSHPHPLTDSSVTMWMDTLASQYAPTKPSPMSIPGVTPGADGGGVGTSEQRPSEQAGADSDGILPYVSGEMGTQFSDGFSFLDTDAQAANPIEHQFSFIGAGLGDPTQNNNGTIDRPSAPQNKTNEFDSQYENFMSTRDTDPYIQRPHQRC